MKYQVIIPAAGLGKRMGAGKNKLLLDLNEVPVLIHTLLVFEADEACSGIVLAISPSDEVEITQLIERYDIKKVIAFAPGGKERQDSVYNALMTLSTQGIVLVHDAARPFIETKSIHEVTAAANEFGAAVIGVPVKDTIKKVQDNKIVETVERSSLWSVQTPQAFRVSVLMEAHERSQKDGFLGTDEASLVERIPHEIKMVEGSYDNIKLTTPEDLYFAEAIIRKRQKKEI
ncbi:2-C-methyl-D-erythritol 4-phosphate cytidylyltransferase [Bacillus sp. DNRA2]|uniref:2-C-methyl-D-erythritol 4-phosphate cytidylyltransferase n=1 Tax=Bacillus sp. DNRA2 TaxID=2723053 RepID=UPI00145EB9C7|nr:2-C-methyl-D-erythritol 4-phosphate cytidylyltransferase [Bacillus sp. DNRA2]NMD72687.1 2-C-methyl-D-erythritol 4-phosphate cytidylyltransferase [Bacillus sp. DNRA2]